MSIDTISLTNVFFRTCYTILQIKKLDGMPERHPEGDEFLQLVNHPFPELPADFVQLDQAGDVAVGAVPN